MYQLRVRSAVGVSTTEQDRVKVEPIDVLMGDAASVAAANVTAVMVGR